MTDIVEQGPEEAQRIGFYVVLAVLNLIPAHPSGQLSDN